MTGRFRVLFRTGRGGRLNLEALVECSASEVSDQLSSELAVMGDKVGGV